MDKLISEYRAELVEDWHSAGSGRYGVHVMFSADISDVFPYLNAVLDNTWYDHDNRVFIGTGNRLRCAFRPHDIRVGINADQSSLSRIAGEVVALVNQVWEERDRIVPSFIERKLPLVYDIFKFLPQTNCKQCGYTTCLAFAADLRNGIVSLEQCPLMVQPEYASNMQRIKALFQPTEC